MQVKAQQLTWLVDKGVKVGCTEYSDLGIRAGEPRPAFIDVHNPETGRTVRFVYSASEYNTRENELLLDVYVPARPDLLRYPHLSNVCLRIFND